MNPQKFAPHKIVKAIEETRALISKETRYPEDLRNNAYLLSLQKMEQRFKAMLAEVAS